jgi:hypothetical protein
MHLSASSSSTCEAAPHLHSCPLKEQVAACMGPGLVPPARFARKGRRDDDAGRVENRQQGTESGSERLGQTLMRPGKSA